MVAALVLSAALAIAPRTSRVVCGIDGARRHFVAAAGSGALAGGLGLAPTPALAIGFGGKGKPSQWTQNSLDIPPESTLFDIDFDPADENHGFVVGTKGLFLETKDGGRSWASKKFTGLDADDDELNYRFTQVSFKDNEGWVVGKPSVLLHTKDGGQNWERIPLSPKLPGEPLTITALGNGKAEMCTSQGAIYYTESSGRNWQAQVQETIEATLNRVSSSGVQGASYFAGAITNVLRNKAGEYLAVSSRGNFFLTWQPGSDFWVPHNRATSRRISNMGFVTDEANSGIWMSTNAGGLSLAKEGADLNQVSLDFDDLKVNSAGFGILDVAFKGDGEVHAGRVARLAGRAQRPLRGWRVCVCVCPEPNPSTSARPVSLSSFPTPLPSRGCVRPVAGICSGWERSSPELQRWREDVEP